MGTRVLRKQGSPLMRSLSIQMMLLMVAWRSADIPTLEQVGTAGAIAPRGLCWGQPAMAAKA